MASETLHFDNARQAQSLYASEPKNLRLVEDLLNLKVTARDGWINVEGSAQDIARAKSLFTELHQAVSRGTVIRRQEFSRAVSAISRGEALKMQELHEGRVDVSTRKRPIIPKTQGQNRYLEAIRKNDIVISIGPAGTGKTYLAMAMAVHALRSDRVGRIILCRPAVEAGEALGFLPGTLEEKVSPYLRPLYDALYDMMDPDEIQRNMERGVIEIAPLAYMRGRTLNNAYVILDEAQNTTSEQMLMFLTRMGFDSKVVITGDITQVDLPGHKTSGLIEIQGILQEIPGLEIVYLNEHDVVRHELVQKIIGAYSKFKEERERRRQESAANGNGKPHAA
ncbi:MAG: PhoH family protein [Verrucomicrobiia bacterium]|jgi:phosphate starvation-inducible PhoH-like protein